MKFKSYAKKFASLTFAALIGITTLSSLSTACHAAVNVELVDYEYDEFGNKIAAVVRFSGQPKDAEHGLLWVIKVEYDPEAPEDAHRAAPDMLQYIAMGNACYDVPVRLRSPAPTEAYRYISIAPPLGWPADHNIHLPLIDAGGNKVFYKIQSMEQALSNGNVTLSLDKDTGYMFLIPIDHQHYWAGHGKEQTEEIFMCPSSQNSRVRTMRDSDAHGGRHNR